MARPIAVHKYQLGYNDGKLSADITLSNSSWTKIWEYTVKANEGIRLGRLRDGYIYLKVVDSSGNTIHGLFRIVVVSPDGEITKVLYTNTTRACGDIADILKKPRLPPLHRYPIRENWKIRIEMKSESASATIDYDNAGNILALDCLKVTYA